jgi:DNA-binding response OmpR family regulator
VAPSYFSSSDENESRPLSRPLRVIVVDDDRDTVVTLVMLLRREGFDASGVSNPWSVMYAIEAFEPDAVIMDIAMPGKTGWDLAREIRTKCGDRAVLIAISGSYVKAPDELLSAVAGFNHFFVKPCDPAKLIGLLGRIVPSK